LSDLEFHLVCDQTQSVSHLLRELYLMRRRGIARHPWERWLGTYPGAVNPDVVGFMASFIVPPWLGYNQDIGGSFSAHVEAMFDDPVPPDPVRELVPEKPALWRHPFQEPRRWVADLAVELEHARDFLSRPWELADMAMAAEAQRIEVASQQSTTKRQLLTQLWAGARVEGPDDAAELIIPHRPGGRPITGRVITNLGLAPILSSTPIVRYLADKPILFMSEPAVHTVSYPMPATAALINRSAPPPPRSGSSTDPLVVLIGAVRASILRLLDRPRQMADLAGLVNLSAATATYHCNQLHQAGLIERHRLGNHVWIRRTTHGAALLDLIG
jgi:hypothetical protein